MRPPPIHGGFGIVYVLCSATCRWSAMNRQMLLFISPPHCPLVHHILLQVVYAMLIPSVRYRALCTATGTLSQSQGPWSLAVGYPGRQRAGATRGTKCTYLSPLPSSLPCISMPVPSPHKSEVTLGARLHILTATPLSPPHTPALKSLKAELSPAFSFRTGFRHWSLVIAHDLATTPAAATSNLYISDSTLLGSWLMALARDE